VVRGSLSGASYSSRGEGGFRQTRRAVRGGTDSFPREHNLCVFLALWLGVSVCRADPSYVPPSQTVRLLDRVPIPKTPPTHLGTTPPVKCTVSTPSGTFVASFDYATMTGSVAADGVVGTRRFNVRAAPYNATYNLVFQGYGPGDQKPASESMTKMTSVVARLVAYGDVLHLFLDSDYHPAVQPPMDGFVCN